MSGLFGFLLDRRLGRDDITRAHTVAQQLAGVQNKAEIQTYFDAPRGLFLAAVNGSSQNDGLAQSGRYTTLLHGRFGRTASASGSPEHGNLCTTLAEMWREQSDSALEKIEGSFAVAIWDGVHLGLAVDGFGSKTLFWVQTVDGIWFATQPAILVEGLGLSFAPTTAEKATFMCLGYTAAGKSGFSGVERLASGTYAKFSAEGLVFSRKTWPYPQTRTRRLHASRISQNEIGEVGDLLAASLKQSCAGLSGAAISLSGGIDSALLAALCTKQLKKPLPVVHFMWPGREKTAEQAKKIAEHLGLDLKTIALEPVAVGHDTVAKLAGYYGVPCDNLAVLPLAQMAKACAEQGIKTLVTTHGADALFYGHAHLHFLFTHRKAYRLGGVFYKASAIFDPVLSGWQKWRHMQRLLRGRRPWKVASILNEAQGPLLERWPYQSDLLREYFCKYGRDPVYQARSFDLRETLPAHRLYALDTAFSAHNVGFVAPYLNKALATRVAAFNQRALLAHGHKHIVRELLGRYIPRELICHTGGLPAPVGPWAAQTKNEDVPVIEGINKDQLAAIWVNRNQPGARNLALRLCQLKQFMPMP